MKFKKYFYTVITLIFILYIILCYNSSFTFNIKSCNKNEFYFDSNSERVYSMDVKIIGNISSDSVLIKINNWRRDFNKYEIDNVVLLHKGKVDTILKDNDWYNDKGQIEYVPYSSNTICDNKLKITIKLHKTLI